MDGILLFDKPLLWTSHDAVDFVRRRTGLRRVGHAGTLDPLATGVLVVLVGAATRLSSALCVEEKEYAGTMLLGVDTDTQDLEGRVTATADCDGVSETRVRETFASLTGDQEQVPPAYSSVRSGGRKLYEWARRGVEVLPPARPIRVTRFDLIRFDSPDVAFSLVCSKGTYVRELAARTGKILGCGATLSSLVRTRVGPYSIDRTAHVEELLTAADVARRLLSIA